jgi:ubiquinone biosynthesis protein UbiJ
MRLKVLLWLLSRLMIRAGKKNPEFAQKAAEKNAVIQIATADGQEIRHFIFSSGQLSSAPGGYDHPDCTVIFKNATFGFSALLPWNKRLQVSGIQNGNIKVAGNFSLFLWFQSLGVLLQQGKKH